jgi:hypothetical protein
MGYGNVNTALPENLRDPMDAETATMRLQDLFLILSQGVDLGLLTITAAFRAPRDLKEILGSGFEMIRISQCESPRVFRVYDKEMSNWRSNSGSQYRSTSVSSKSFSCWDLRRKSGISHPPGSAADPDRPVAIPPSTPIGCDLLFSKRVIFLAHRTTCKRLTGPLHLSCAIRVSGAVRIVRKSGHIVAVEVDSC